MVRANKDLWLIDTLTALLVTLIFFLPTSVGRYLLAVPVVLFFPGYTLMAALFPKRNSLGNMERIAFSLAMGTVLGPMMGLLWHYTPWGITLQTSLISIVLFIFLASFAAWLRRRQLTEAERHAVGAGIDLGFWVKGNTLDKSLSVLVVASLLGALGAFSYTVFSPKVGERFTEFYILGQPGEAWDYPHREMVVGEEIKETLGIVNQEQQESTYRVEVRIGGEKVKEIGPLTLGHGESWEEAVSFSPQKPSTLREMKFWRQVEGRPPEEVVRLVPSEQKLEFLLYKYGDPQPYRTLSRWVNVWEATAKFTEFYLASFPRRTFFVGFSDAGIVGIVNHEGRPLTYSVEVVMAGQTATYGRPRVKVLAPGEKWEADVHFLPWTPGKQLVEFLLFAAEVDKPDIPIRAIYLELAIETRGE